MSPSDPQPAELPDELYGAFVLLNEIGIVNQLSSARFEAVLPDGLSRAQFSVLNNFVRLGGTRTPAQLAQAFQVTRGAMTNTLQRLEANGYITLTPSPADGRGKEVRITDQGRQVRDRAISNLIPDLKTMTASLDAAAFQVALPFLQQLRRWLDENRQAARA